MVERRFGRKFGAGTFLGDSGDSFMNKPLTEQVLEMGWSHACPVIDTVVRDYGLKWTLERYSECNFVFRLITSRAEKLNYNLYKQLIRPVKRLPGEFPKQGLNPNLIPANFDQEMSPLSTPWGYALPRIVIEQMGRGKDNNDRTQARILKALDIVDDAIQISETPVQLLVNIAEKNIMEKADPKAVLAHMLSNSVLQEEGCRTIFKEIRQQMDKLAPFLKQTYDAFSPEERASADIANL